MTPLLNYFFKYILVFGSFSQEQLKIKRKRKLFLERCQRKSTPVDKNCVGKKTKIININKKRTSPGKDAMT